MVVHEFLINFLDRRLNSFKGMGVSLTANMRRERNVIRNMIVVDILFNVLVVIVGGGDVEVVHLSQKNGQRPCSTKKSEHLQFVSQKHLQVPTK